jgi:hypothetical protein
VIRIGFGDVSLLTYSMELEETTNPNHFTVSYNCKNLLKGSVNVCATGL